MFYRPEDGHGLPHNPFKALVSPRPIGWIGSQDAAGVHNLAPYSFFNAIADAPPMVMFSSTGAKPDGSRKDSVANIRETGVFTVTIVGWNQRDAMNMSSGPWDAAEDEFARAGLQALPGEVVAAPRVAGAPAALECRLHQVLDLPGEANRMVIGQVVGIHIDDAMLPGGQYDVTRAGHLARLGYRDYSVTREVFAMTRPGQR